MIGACRKHLASVNESYFQHLGFALFFAARLFAAGFAVLVHALIPCLFEKTGSRIINQLHDRLHNRQHQEKKAL
jgi:hypothetical protein